jgi:hypothetical protein
MNRKRILWFVAGLAAVAVATAGFTAILAGSGDADSSAVGPTATPKPIDPGIGNGQPPATSGPGVAPGEPTPPSRPGPDQPSSNRDTPTRPAPTWTPSPGGTATPGTVRVLAPIDGLDMAVLESFPPQYLLQIQAGLPSGCAKADGYELSRSGNEIRVAVFNTLPAGNPVCTAIYGMYDLNINLGSSFTSSEEYRVNVNGKTITFRAQ